MDLTAFVAGAPLRTTMRPRAARNICMTSEKGSTDAEKPQDAAVSKKPIKTIRSSATWADVFLPDFGRKGPGSRPDWDLRPKSMRTVEEGKGVCDSCKGTGTMTCSFCLGTQFVTATGKVEPCPACAGKVNVTCSACFGSAKQIEMEGNWWDRGVAALFKD